MNKFLMILALALPFAASAADKNGRAELGDDVRAWTDMQKSGSASVTDVRPMPGEVADKVYDRYLQSFSYPIPQSYQRQSFVGGGGGGGSSSGGGSGGGQ
jgi:hypothetical protein